MDEPREIDIHQALVRPQLIAGAERLPFAINLIMILALVAGLHFHPVALAGAGLLGLGHLGLVLAAKVDPQLSGVYFRHLYYRPFYPAQSGVHARPPLIEPAVPVRE
jgi:type IV secretion system protein VirB3